MQNHTHNGTDSPKLVIQEAIERVPQDAVTEITKTAGATYGANEQSMLGDIKASLNDLIDKLQEIGLLK